MASAAPPGTRQKDGHRRAAAGSVLLLSGVRGTCVRKQKSSVPTAVRQLLQFARMSLFSAGELSDLVRLRIELHERMKRLLKEEEESEERKAKVKELDRESHTHTHTHTHSHTHV